MSTAANLHLKSKKSAIKPGPSSTTCAAETFIQGEDARKAAVAVRAYYCAQQRGFEPGYELDDWLTAEQEECHGH